MAAVFSGSSVLESENQQDRVPDAIAAGPDFPTSLVPDIPEDFRVNGNIIEIPEGATHLFLSPHDANFSDNTDPDGDFRIRITFPTAPSGIAASAPSETVSLQWESSSFASVEDYRVYRSTTPIDSTTSPASLSAIDNTLGEPMYVDQSVTLGTSYFYRITAVDTLGNESGFSRQVVATPGTLPSPPSNLSVEATGDSSVSLQWTASIADDVERYRLYRDTDTIDTSAPPLPFDSTTAAETQYEDDGLLPGRTYHYRVTAVDSDGEESPFSANVTGRPPQSVVAVDDSATVVQGGTTRVEVLANDIRGQTPIDTSSVAVVSRPEHGTTSLDRSTGHVQYAHDPSVQADDSFSYLVNDEGGASDTARVFVSVAALTLTSPDSVDAGRAQVSGPGAVRTLRFENTGEATASGLSLGLTNESDYAVLDDTGQESLAPGSTRTVQVAFRPTEADTVTSTTVSLTSETSIQETTVLTGVGIGVEVTPQIEGGTAPRGTAIPLSVTTQGPFEAESHHLYVRRGGEQSFHKLDDASQIPDSLVTERGVDYYVALTDGDLTLVSPGGAMTAARRAPFHLPVRFDSLTVPLTFAPETYRMVSVPARTSVTDALERSYGAYDPGAWRMLRWDPTAGENGDYRAYPAVDSLGAGMSMWLITARGAGFSLREGRMVDASTAKEIVLQPGWNQIGSPFGFSVPWDTVLAASALSPSDVDGPVAYRDTGDGGSYRYNQSVLRSWEGYFVHNRSSEPDTLVVPPVGPDAAPSRKEMPPADSTYTLRVSTHMNGTRAQQIRLGLRPDAQAGPDALDVAQAPPIGRSVQLSVTEDGSGDNAARTTRWAGSFKPTDENGQRWRLSLTNRSAETEQTVKLRMSAQGTLPDGQRRYLLDLGRERHMVNGQELSLDPGETRRLKVIVGTKAYAEKNSEGISMEQFTNELRDNYPNPFGEATTIEYVLAEEQDVTIRIYNVLGQQVRTLTQGTKRPGLHHLRWEGENRYGTPVGSGVYFYRIEAKSFTETRKMVLVR
jgi:fibronectin type 3 domain-containing protein